jgi:tetratricopeptide (TPR) repeat protein
MRGGRGAVTSVAAAGLLAAAIAVQAGRDRMYPRTESDTRAVMYVRSGSAMRRIALAYDALASDVYWIRAVQHYGGDRLSDERQQKYERLYPLLDLATSLDPYFTIAYRFGAIFLSEKYPSGAGRPEQAIALLEKGIAVQPTKWAYYHDIAFVHYWQREDKKEAARWFRLAAAQPGAPNWLEPVAATMMIEGGDRASARFLLQQIQKSEEAWLRRMATRSLQQLDVLDALDRVHQRVRTQPPPASGVYTWDWFVRSGILAQVPVVDPTGEPLEVDPATGRLMVSPSSELYPMPAVSSPR